ncbi:MAG: hypothetical protein K8R92_00865 [Planctomycetes bacterium]|nr:hypothetical protein [Planctomycetota bacterium]
MSQNELIKPLRIQVEKLLTLAEELATKQWSDPSLPVRTNEYILSVDGLRFHINQAFDEIQKPAAPSPQLEISVGSQLGGAISHDLASQLKHGTALYWNSTRKVFTTTKPAD